VINRQCTFRGALGLEECVGLLSPVHNYCRFAVSRARLRRDTFSAMREHVVQIVEKYIDAVRSNDASELPLHPDVVCEFPTNTYRGAASFRQGLDQSALIMKSIDVIRLVVDGEHCVAIVNIDTVFGLIPFAEHIHVSNGEIVSIRGYCDPRPMLSGANTSA
jgi:hypothetical protein